MHTQHSALSTQHSARLSKPKRKYEAIAIIGIVLGLSVTQANAACSFNDQLEKQIKLNLYTAASEDLDEKLKGTGTCKSRFTFLPCWRAIKRSEEGKFYSGIVSELANINCPITKPGLRSYITTYLSNL